MGTRSIVLVPEGAKPKFGLYHHWDGYPENMLGVIGKAFRLSVNSKEPARDDRPSKLGAKLIAGDPEGFDVEPFDFAHGDLEFAYVVRSSGEWVSRHPGILRQWDVTVWDDDPFHNSKARKVGEATYQLIKNTTRKGGTSLECRGSAAGGVKVYRNGSTNWARQRKARLGVARMTA